MDYEQPDSTTAADTAVANDLISLGEESAPVKPTEYIPPAKEEVKFEAKKITEKVSTPVTETKCVADDTCPVCKFVDHLGEVVPSPLYDILAWKDVYKTAVIFFTILPLLVLYSYCNPIVVTAYLLLGLVTSTFTYRAYRYVVDSFQKSEVTNPFKGFGDLEVDSSRQLVLEWADRVLPIFINLVNRLKHYILVEDILDTIKFAVLLYLTAVVGGYFSLRLLSILAFAGAFTLPKVYALYKPEITNFMQQLHVAIKTQMRAAKKQVLTWKEQAISAATKKRN